MENMVKKLLKDAGYSNTQIKLGFEYANKIGYSTGDDLGKLALTRILYSDSQIADGEVAGWEPVDWSDYE